MKILRGFLKALTTIVALLGVAVYILVNHSVTETALICTGTWVQGRGEWKGRPETVAATIVEYRPWIVWIDSQGYLQAESRDRVMTLFAGHLLHLGDGARPNYWFSRGSNKPVIASYRSAFKELTVEFDEGMVFTGLCDQQS